METLALAGAAIEYVQMLANRVVRASLFGQFEVRFDNVGDVTQQGGGPLLSVVFDQADQILGAPSLHCPANTGGR